MKQFHIGDIISITTGKLVSPQLIDGVYDILNYMTADNLYTHQIGRAMAECRPWLLTQHPQLKDINTNTVNKDNWKDWLSKQIEQYGEYLEVKPLPKNIHDFIDPLDELKRMLPEEKIIVIKNSGNTSEKVP